MLEDDDKSHLSSAGCARQPLDGFASSFSALVLPSYKRLKCNNDILTKPVAAQALPPVGGGKPCIPYDEADDTLLAAPLETRTIHPPCAFRRRMRQRRNIGHPARSRSPGSAHIPGPAIYPVKEGGRVPRPAPAGRVGANPRAIIRV